MTTLRASAEHNALRHPKFVLYLIAIGCASFAVQIMSVSVGWEIYDITRDPLYLGYVGLVQFLPPLLHSGDKIKFVSGPMTDRVGIFSCTWDDDRVIVLLDLLGRSIEVAAERDAIAAYA